MISIHDPLHGAIAVSPSELALIDSRAFQRLRHIKQLGFSDLAFPGATHTRYAHSLGAMHIATAIADRVLGALDLPTDERLRLRQTVRLATLFHDLGHPPMSHSSECVMPPVSALQLDAWTRNNPERQATHEDYSIKLLTDSDLTQIIATQFGTQGVTGARLAALIVGKPPPNDEGAFVIGGQDLLPVLSQIVSSEMDADRMDYLRRDAYYCGVSYGTFDHTWLASNITAVPWEGQLGLALQHKAVWAFENFLLARYHMFLAVYYHHTTVGFEHLLSRYFESREYVLPADSDAYLQTDDVHLTTALRTSQDPWAAMVVQRRGYRLLLETHAFEGDDERRDIDERLQQAGIDFFRVRSHGALSKYLGADGGFPLLVWEPELERVRPMAKYTPLYERFADGVGVARLYCHPEQFDKARTLLNS